MKSSKCGTGHTIFLNCWFWIAFVFFGQAVCSILFASHVKIPFNDLLLPIAVLLAGSIYGLLFLIFGSSGKCPQWQALFPALAYGSFIYLMSSKSFSGIGVGFDTSYFHPVEYTSLGLFLGLAWYRVIEQKGFLAFAVRVTTVGAGFGLSDEIHQLFVPGRTAEVIDFVFDVAGIMFSLMIIALARRVGQGLRRERQILES